MKKLPFAMVLKVDGPSKLEHSLIYTPYGAARGLRYRGPFNSSQLITKSSCFKIIEKLCPQQP